ncbi:MAG TPA: MauE/DoxX family redox-associated membrane protein [Acidimicrobiales bacterium]|nr:MauE/DoxX family redox-associated membrane protein [Acidimicrobiales bacterium]
MAARIALGLVLMWAGTAKLVQPAWPATAASFGAPSWLIPVLPWAELVLGSLLVPGVGLPWTALVALVLLATFTVAVAVKLGKGADVPCGCFGETSAAPVRWDSLVRNLVLCGLAVAAAVGGGHGPGAALLGIGVAFLVIFESRARTPARR